MSEPPSLASFVGKRFRIITGDTTYGLSSSPKKNEANKKLMAAPHGIHHIIIIHARHVMPVIARRKSGLAAGQKKRFRVVGSNGRIGKSGPNKKTLVLFCLSPPLRPPLFSFRFVQYCARREREKKLGGGGGRRDDPRFAGGAERRQCPSRSREAFFFSILPFDHGGGPFSRVFETRRSKEVRFAWSCVRL